MENAVVKFAVYVLLIAAIYTYWVKLPKCLLASECGSNPSPRRNYISLRHRCHIDIYSFVPGLCLIRLRNHSIPWSRKLLILVPRPHPQPEVRNSRSKCNLPSHERLPSQQVNKANEYLNTPFPVFLFYSSFSINLPFHHKSAIISQLCSRP